MTSPLPPVDYEATPVNPAGLGLFAASSVIPTGRPTRIQAGVLIRPINCETAYGTWPSDPCADPGVLRKEGDREPGLPAFEAIQPWAYDECDPLETAEGTRRRANQTLRLHEQSLVESTFAARLLTDAGAAASATSLAEAVALMEVRLGEMGLLGVFHASRRFAAFAARAGLLFGSGSVYKTPLGHSWAFGGGYDSVLTNTIVATTPTTIWQDEASVFDTLDPNINRQVAIAERTFVVGYECSVGAVTVPWPAPDGGGSGGGGDNELTLPDP